MSNPYVGEIRLFAGTFAPNGWLFCDGQQLPISEYETLFNLIGTTYGGDGQTTFNLPDLRGRLPLHQGTAQGTTFVIGESGGVEQVTLTAAQVPQHTHTLSGSAANATQTSPTGGVPATMPEVTTFAYGTDLPATTLHPNSVSSSGGNLPHENLQPYLCLNFIISLFGIYPAPN